MQVARFETKEQMGQAAAAAGAEAIRRAVSREGETAIIVATGASQFEMLAALTAAPDIPWPQVTVFHLDEYIGIPESHPASFRRYLRERFLAYLAQQPRAFHAIDGEGDPAAECARLNALIAPVQIEVAFIGIGENGHLAFNDPPADFQTETPFLVVTLDTACRRQQLGEGWFPTLDNVPRQAISMSIRQILKSHKIVCTVPDARKAAAVRAAVEGPVTPDLPASILQQHPDSTLFLDRESSARLSDSA